jgi:hypothetical protein
LWKWYFSSRIKNSADIFELKPSFFFDILIKMTLLKWNSKNKNWHHYIFWKLPKCFFKAYFSTTKNSLRKYNGANCSKFWCLIAKYSKKWSFFCNIFKFFMDATVGVVVHMIDRKFYKHLTFVRPNFFSQTVLKKRFRIKMWKPKNQCLWAIIVFKKTEQQVTFTQVYWKCFRVPRIVLVALL